MEKLVLIDGHAILHRAYHAYPPLTNSKGELVGAVYGFTSILLTVLKKLHPKYAAVAFDKKSPTFRHKKYKDYKAHRKPMDEDLIKQILPVHEVVEVLSIPIFEVDGYEADDVIGTLASQAVEGVRISHFKSNARPKQGKTLSEKTDLARRKFARNLDKKNKGDRSKFSTHFEMDIAYPLKTLGAQSLEILIVTGDQDAMQLVDGNVKVYMPARGRQPEKIYDEKEVLKKYGLKPVQIVDFKALAGDASDGIPGVTGIGPKTAVKLLNEYNTLESIYTSLDELPNKVAQKLERDEKQALLSQELARIDKNSPVRLDLRSCRLTDYDRGKVIKLFEELEFKSLINKLPENEWMEMAEEVVGGMEKKTKPKKSKGEGRQMGLF